MLTFPGTHGQVNEQLTQSSRTAPLWPAMILCAILATLINFGSIHRGLNADAICPVPTSLYAWTPYYWDTIRYGQLLPLLAMPFKNPLTNLLVQSELTCFSVLATLFLFPRYLKRGPHWPLTGAGLTLLLLLIAPRNYLHLQFSAGQCYGPAMALTAVGLLLLEDFPGWRQAPWRLFGAIVLLLLAHWVNSALAILLIPLYLLRYVCGRQISWKECVTGILVSGGTFVAMYAASHLVRVWEIQLEDPIFPFSISPMTEWLPKWRMLIKTFLNDSGFLAPVFLATLILPVRIAMKTFESRRWLLDAVRRLTPVLLAGTFFSLLITSLAWIEITNHRMHRYAIPAIYLVTTTLAAVCWEEWMPILTRGRSSTRVAGFVTLLLVVATLGRMGSPSLAGVRRNVDDLCGGFTDELRATGCTHLAGNYWKVWPAMFHANLVAYEQGEPPRVWGTTYRSTALQRRWRDNPVQDFKLALIDEKSFKFMRPVALNLAEMTREHRALFDVAVPPELFFVWARGFYGEEQSAGNAFHWARRTADLWVCNRSNETRQVRLDMQLLRDQGAAADLRIRSDWFHDELSINENVQSWSRILSLPPGWHTITFTCTGTRIPPGQDPNRWLVFRVLNARLSHAPEPQPASQPASPENARPDLVASREENRGKD